MSAEIESNWKGSIYNMSCVAHEIKKRYGDEAVKRYDPQLNCFTYKGWKQRGFQVRKGEKGIEILNFIPVTIDEKKEDGTVKTKNRAMVRTSYVFFETQVNPIKGRA